MRAEIEGRRRVGAKPANRARHLLSSLIRCGVCGSAYTLAGKDYYRCAPNRERGTCANAVSVRVLVVEEAVLSALPSELLTPDLVRLFAEEFRREVDRLTRTRDERDANARRRISELDVEIGNLTRHFLAGAVSPTLSAMLAEREAERDLLKGKLAAPVPADATVVPHPALVELYQRKVVTLREALNDEAVRADATWSAASPSRLATVG